MRSIRRNLLFWLALGLTGAILLAGITLYFQARSEANALFDYQMKQIVASLPRQAFSPIDPDRDVAPEMSDDIMIQIWNNTGVVIYHSHTQAALPLQAELGFTDIQQNNGIWRVYSAQIGNTVVQVAQPQRARQIIAAQMAIKTVAPLLLLIPLLGLLIWVVVGHGLAPIKRAAAEVQTRDFHSLAAIEDGGLPQEIQPLTQALNDLLARLGGAIDAQRAFVADAAHELRTPLTALRLQVQLAERATGAEDRQASFADLQKGLDRATHLLNQLLTLTRQEPGAFEQPHVPIDLTALVRSVVADFSNAALARHIDLGIIDLGISDQCINAAAEVSVTGNVDALRVLFNNLIDNALRHTPEHGVIDVLIVLSDAGSDAISLTLSSAASIATSGAPKTSTSQTGKFVTVTVRDSGPGIPETDLPRVFDRFYRVPSTQSQFHGSGLGLAIVRQIADAHHATVALHNHGAGLSASIRFAI
ncbi:sensor histidine kinase [Glaciimonas immobilis]|uniref:histidine kinase n=1 Tax=Glaciimonas immobilis TaxID=728004 RepID=A0A840RY89_9BURK|nr:ATP-binding protein [Glaciimonas immobilis]KAF3996354.1 two-component sensor histidine kinase [Glaciimonas immobilis]MBB5202192.1 two-component system OmpR family sensor kinase [Glaciimonas immobilis]